MKIVETRSMDVAYENEFEKKLQEKGIQYKVVAREFKIYERTGSIEFDLFEYTNSLGEHVLLATRGGGMADEAFEEGVLFLLEENEEVDLSVVKQMLIDYDNISYLSYYELLTAKQISEMYEVSESVVRKAINDGRLVEYKDAIKAGTTWLVDRKVAKKLWGKK